MGFMRMGADGFGCGQGFGGVAGDFGISGGMGKRTRLPVRLPRSNEHGQEYLPMPPKIGLPKSVATPHFSRDRPVVFGQ